MSENGAVPAAGSSNPVPVNRALSMEEAVCHVLRESGDAPVKVLAQRAAKLRGGPVSHASVYKARSSMRFAGLISRTSVNNARDALELVMASHPGLTGPQLCEKASQALGMRVRKAVLYKTLRAMRDRAERYAKRELLPEFVAYLSLLPPKSQRHVEIGKLSGQYRRAVAGREEPPDFWTNPAVISSEKPQPAAVPVSSMTDEAATAALLASMMAYSRAKGTEELKRLTQLVCQLQGS